MASCQSQRKKRMGLPESLPKDRDLWHYIRVVTEKLSAVLEVLERLAPLRFAEPWDNVGLLLEPVRMADAPPVVHALLTIELSEEVVTEAEQLGATLIVAYHPPIFKALKRLRQSEPSERLLLRCVASGIAIYSPHTALDAAPDGVNSWLLDAFAAGERAPCVPHPLDARYGAGRSLRLAQPITLSQAVALLKNHLGLTHLRVAEAVAPAAGGAITSIAACAGAGGSVFEKLPHFDLFLTGEMRHHDVRERALGGSYVVLAEHTHTERGFLKVLAERLVAATSGAVTFHVSRCDRDPLSLV
jgi:dinuclear metal center YbgI/SA1388 family protein